MTTQMNTKDNNIFNFDSWISEVKPQLIAALQKKQQESKKQKK